MGEGSGVAAGVRDQVVRIFESAEATGDASALGELAGVIDTMATGGIASSVCTALTRLCERVGEVLSGHAPRCP
eukprot:2031829-Prymnesium_polylepis.1